MIKPGKINLLICLGLIAYLIFFLSGLYRPLIADDAFNVVAFQAKEVGYLGIYGHPPLYHDIARTLVNSLGIRNENLRLLGMACFLLSLYLINLICRQVSKDKLTGPLACALYALHPLVIQGSLVLDIDNTILTMVLLVSILYFLKVYEATRLKNIIFLGLLFFLGLWCKLSTANILVLAIFISYIFRARLKQGLSAAAIIVGLGFGLFVLCWFLYTSVYNMNFFGRSFHVLFRSISGPTFGGLRELALRFARVYLWLGPYFVLFWLWIIIARVRAYLLGQKKFSALDFLLLYSLLVFFAYIIVAGSTFGFAKYHYPIVSVICILIANFIAALRPLQIKKRWFVLIAFAFAFVILDWAKVGDLLYQVNYSLRKLVIFSPAELNSFLLTFMGRVVIYHLPLILGAVLVLLWEKKARRTKTVVLLLLTLTLVSNLSLDIRQARADYFTTLCYGRSIKEFKQLEGFLKKVHRHNPEGIIIGPEDVITRAIGLWYPGYTYDIFRNRRDKFLKAIKEKKVSCVIYGFTWNMVYSFQEVFFHPEVRKVLEEQYRFYPWGEYELWLKKQ